MRTVCNVCIRTYYTYNTITRLGILGGECSAVTATDGGKVEVWDLTSGANLLSQTVHDTSITAISCRGQTLVTADSKATIKMFQLRKEDSQWRLSCVYQSEDVVTSVAERPILAITTSGEKQVLSRNHITSAEKLSYRCQPNFLSV